jgi:hypothetical protein
MKLMRRLFASIAGVLLGSCLVFSPAAGQQSAKEPRCGVFFENWDVPGVPAPMLIMSGIGREVMAATDCVRSKRLPTACEHYQRILNVLDRKEAELLALDRTEIEGLMRQINCPL